MSVVADPSVVDRLRKLVDRAELRAGSCARWGHRAEASIRFGAAARIQETVAELSGLEADQWRLRILRGKAEDYAQA